MAVAPGGGGAAGEEKVLSGGDADGVAGAQGGGGEQVRRAMKVVLQRAALRYASRAVAFPRVEPKFRALRRVPNTLRLTSMELATRAHVAHTSTESHLINAESYIRFVRTEHIYAD